MSRFFPAEGTALTNTDRRGEQSAPPGHSAYQYAVLRFVPRVEREEFCNVGVVVYSQTDGVLRVAWHIDEARIRALYPHAEVEALTAQLRTLEQIVDGVPGDGRPTLDKLITRFGWISAPRSTALQPGPVHGGITTDLTAEVDRLLDLLVRG